MTWRAARSLPVLHQQLKAGAPRAAPPATGADEWGLIGDVLHDPTSDHAPHDFTGWGSQIVTAADFPNRPDLGLDAHRVLDDIRRSRDPRAKYGISNGQIFSNHAVTEHGHSYLAWAWRPYLTSSGARPADGHYTHGHLSVVGDARADGTQPWQTIGAPASTESTTEKDEDVMGQSFGPIEIQAEGKTSLNIPPVNAGLADPRQTWLNICNDAPLYALRIWFSDGTNWAPIPEGTVVREESGSQTKIGPDGGLVCMNGRRYSYQLPTGTACVSITRKPHIADTPPYAGHLTCCFERQ